MVSWPDLVAWSRLLGGKLAFQRQMPDGPTGDSRPNTTDGLRLLEDVTLGSVM